MKFAPAELARLTASHLLAGNILLKLNQRERAVIEYQEYLRLAPKGDFAAEARNLVDKLKANNR